MILLILSLFSVIIILFLVVIGVVIIYHFKRFGIKDDQNIKKILNIFKIGGGIIIILNLVLLFLLTL